ncbi:tripartite tricarboxylate transporter substrate binding protein [Salibacterium aidingense]|uniref:tripartite tricarboxylate transporter substrate binding protein n=1 Tax=Salibacterium aidingense TaxID=384933 RepID=UPI003BE1B893
MKFKNFSKSRFVMFFAAGLAFSVLLMGCGADSAEGPADNDPPQGESNENRENNKAAGQEDQEEEVGFPTRPLEITLPWAPGGSSDLTLRALAEIVEPNVDVPINIVNREGAGGTIGIMEGANKNPDGHEITFTASGAMTAQPHMRDVQYENDDFTGIVGLTYEPVLLAVSADSDWETLDDLIAEKDTDRVINFGHSGAGGFPHVTQEAFYSQAGINAESVPFEGGGPAVTGLLGGHVDSIAAHPAELMPHVESGDMRLLGIFSEERFDELEDVPTFKEKGFDLNMSVWKALLVPNDTPDEAVAELRDIFTEAVNSPEYAEFLEENNLAPIDIKPEEIIPTLNEQYEATGDVLSSLDLEEE